MPNGYAAECNNAECGKEQWSLQKHPADYARGWPECPDCGTTNVAVNGTSRQEFEARAGQASQQGAQRAQGGQGRAPAPAPTDSSRDAQAPARGGEMADVMETGVQVGDMLHKMNSDDPSESAAAKGSLLKTGGAIFARLGQRLEEQEKQRHENAKQASDDDIRVAQNRPSCPECGQGLKGIPDNGVFNCPSCGELLEVTA